MTLNLCAHPADYADRILAVFEGPAASLLPATDEPDTDEDSDEDADRL
jgi:hypothetical protein